MAAVTPSLFTCLQPFLSLVGAAFFLGMSFSWRDFSGLGLILAGVLLVIYIKAQEIRRWAGRCAPHAGLNEQKVQTSSSLLLYLVFSILKLACFECTSLSITRVSLALRSRSLLALPSPGPMHKQR